jgi:biofilm PGA synthesis N-glycosyltransferase PgaC
VRSAWFWAPTVMLGWVYCGYPLAAAVAGRVRPFRVRMSLPPPELVTVGVVARDEAAEIEERVIDITAQTVPFGLEVIVASDGSTDGTVAIVSRLSGSDRRIRLLDLPRGGQAAAQNAIVRSATGEIVVLTDAATRFAPGCIAALVAPFADPRVGCTTGHLEWRSDDATAAARHEGLYWRYELLLRRLESRAGWLTAATGAVLAARRSCFREVSRHASMDQLVPLHVRDQGATVLAVREARAFDRIWSDRHDQFVSRARIATQGIAANLSMAPRLAPWRRPSASLAIWSHKLLRWATPWLSLGALVGAARLVRAGRSLYAIPLAGALSTLLAAIAGLLAERSGRSLPMASLPITVVTVNVAFVAGWVNLVRRRRIDSWVHHRGRPTDA